MGKEGIKIAKSEADRKQEWLNEEVKVEFMNLEEPGLALKFAFGPSGKAKKYTLLHGGTYVLPRRVVEHVESRQVPIWAYRPNGLGQMQKERTGSKSRFQCRQVFA